MRIDLILFFSSLLLNIQLVSFGERFGKLQFLGLLLTVHAWDLFDDLTEANSSIIFQFLANILRVISVGNQASIIIRKLVLMCFWLNNVTFYFSARIGHTLLLLLRVLCAKVNLWAVLGAFIRILDQRRLITLIRIYFLLILNIQIFVGLLVSNFLILVWRNADLRDVLFVILFVWASCHRILKLGLYVSAAALRRSWHLLFFLLHLIFCVPLTFKIN